MRKLLTNTFRATPGTERNLFQNLLLGAKLILKGDFARLSRAIHHHVFDPHETMVQWFSGEFDYRVLAGFRSTRGVVKQVWDGEQQISQDEEFRLVLYSHYDSDHMIDDYVLYQLRALADLPAKIIFVSTAENLKDSSLESIYPLCHKIVLQHNIGFDFGAWKTALTLYGSVVERANSIILTNDSCYGPFRSLREVVETLEAKSDCLSGITANHIIDYHIQSYMLVLGSRVLRSAFFPAFKRRLKYLRSKETVIKKFEVGTSRLARKYGVHLNPWVSEDSLTQAECPSDLLKTNPCHFLWDILLFKGLSPFIKRSLFSDPYLRRALGDKEGSFWDYLQHETDYPPELIENNLSRNGIPVARGRDCDE